MNTSTDTYLQIQTARMKTIKTRSKLDDVLSYNTKKSVMDGWLYSVPEYNFKFLEYLYLDSTMFPPRPKNKNNRKVHPDGVKLEKNSIEMREVVLDMSGNAGSNINLDLERDILVNHHNN